MNAHRVFRDSSGDGWRWQAGAVFGSADTEQEAYTLAARAEKPDSKPTLQSKRKPRGKRAA